MKVVINALSATNISSGHVLFGHLRQIVKSDCKNRKYFVLYSESNKKKNVNMGPSVKWVRCPGYTGHWITRALWEYFKLPGLLSEIGADIYFTPAGAITSSIRIPQICFAQNPWFLVNSIKKSPYGELKSIMQRANYNVAMSEAAVMVFNSKYMRNLYRKNAGFFEKSSEIVYQAIDDETHLAASEIFKEYDQRKQQILAVSAMADHKNIESLVRAVNVLCRKYCLSVGLILAGPWADKRYKYKIEQLIKKLGLNDLIKITGYVTRQELNDLYASSRVFCLMSRCESFGIPAVEAQAFGAPVVSSNCCAIQEICENGGVYVDPDDFEKVAEEINKLLTDSIYWGKMSELARRNAGKYKWEECSKPLLKIFNTFTNK